MNDSKLPNPMGKKSTTTFDNSCFFCTKSLLKGTEVYMATGLTEKKWALWCTDHDPNFYQNQANFSGTTIRAIDGLNYNPRVKLDTPVAVAAKAMNPPPPMVLKEENEILLANLSPHKDFGWTWVTMEAEVSTDDKSLRSLVRLSRVTPTVRVADLVEQFGDYLARNGIRFINKLVVEKERKP